jgi:hypothetical protein
MGLPFTTDKPQLQVGVTEIELHWNSGDGDISKIHVKM